MDTGLRLGDQICPVSCSGNGSKLQKVTVLCGHWLSWRPQFTKGFIRVCQPQNSWECQAAGSGFEYLLEALRNQSFKRQVGVRNGFLGC